MFQGATHCRKPFVKSGLMAYSLIGPVGCKTVFSHVVHPFCPYLHFKETSFLVLYRNVQGFISVWLRIGYPVAQTFGV